MLLRTGLIAVLAATSIVPLFAVSGDVEILPNSRPAVGGNGGIMYDTVKLEVEWGFVT